MIDGLLTAPDAIPNRIFQTWKRKDALPEKCAYWRSTLLQKNPDFEFELWDDADNRRFIAENVAWFLPIYDSYRAEIYRVDIVRYFYLYLKGGFYIDLDTECLRPLAKYLQYPGIVLGRMGTDPDIENSVPNAIMASRPREQFWLFVIAMAMKSSALRDAPPEVLTGPILLKRALNFYVSKSRWRIARHVRRCASQMTEAQQPRAEKSKIFLVPAHEWYPINWTVTADHELRERVLNYQLLSDEQKQALFPEASLVTYWMHSW